MLNKNSRINVLVVDDEPDFLDLIRHVMESYGFKVFTAEDGDKAYQLIKNDKNINVVMSDIMMPKCDGWTLLTRIREELKRKDMLFYFLSAYCRENNKEESNKRLKSLKAKRYYQKPFKVKEIVSDLKVDLGLS